MIDPTRDGRPLLFHAVLLTATYYNSTESDCYLRRYNSLVAVVNTVVAPQILCPQTNQFNTDFVRALILLQNYKPVQYEALQLNGTWDAFEAEVASKLNESTNLLLQSLITRSAYAIGLHMVPIAFLRCFFPTESTTSAPQMLSDLRLWFSLCIAHKHCSLQNGRPANIDFTDTLKVTRLFASIKSEPSDVRLAAITELYALPSRATISEPDEKYKALDFSRFNAEYALWEEHWVPLLKEASLVGDSLAYSALFPNGNYLRLVVNSSVLGGWVSDWQGSSASDNVCRPELNAQDWESIRIATDAAEKIIFALSMESRSSSNQMREVVWPKKRGKVRPPLHLDLEVVERYRTALDTVICVVESFFLGLSSN
jgi:hypothetical protein